MDLPHVIKQYATEKGVPLTLHENRFFAMRFNGYYHYLDAVKYARAVVMAPRFPNGDFLLVRLRRAPAIGFSLEFPRGGVDEGELLEHAAMREMSEETGYAVPLTAVRRIGELAPDTATLNSTEDVFLVNISDDAKAGQYDTDEIDQPIRVSASRFRELARNGGITCGITLAAYALLLLQNPESVAA
jgi:ADP-ribose pyrophosphatase